MPSARKLYGLGQDSTIDVPTFDQTSPILSVQPTSTPTDWTGLFNALSNAAVSGAKIFQSLQTPALVAGTQAVYNQATGQFYNPTTGQVVNPTGQTLATSPVVGSSLLLIGGLVIGGVVLIALMKGGK